MLSKGAMRVLAELRDLEVKANAQENGDADDWPEIACEGIECYLGHRRIHARTVRSLLECMAISDSAEGSFHRYTINDTGRAILRRPALADEVMIALCCGQGAFTIDGNDKLVRMP